MAAGNIDLNGKVALVTGANRGIGAGVASLLAQHGARVAVHFGGDRQAAEKVLAGLPGAGHVVLGADLGDPEAAAKLPDRAVEALGRLDIVVNNAGIFEPHDIASLDFADWRQAWDRTLAVNLDGPAHVIKGAIVHLEKAGGGHIVNVTSRGAYRGEPEAPAYGVSKAGLNSLTQSLARALAPRNIHLVAVAPGWVLTDMTSEHLAGEKGQEIRAQSPLNRTAEVDEIAQVVLLAVSGRADALTGSVIDVNCASYFR
jgi:3-oxoacyl-[acyl-carrier protein] reductase